MDTGSDAKHKQTFIKKSSNIKNTPLVPSNKKKQSSHHSKFKSTRWYLREKQSLSVNPDYMFQHYTDLNRYMEEYRNIKVEKLKQEFELEEPIKPANVSHENTIVDMKLNEKSHPICLQYSNLNENLGRGVEQQKKHSTKDVSVQQKKRFGFITVGL